MKDDFFSPIKDGIHFEELVLAYFETLREQNTLIQGCKILPSGTGADGGRDVLVKLLLDDDFEQFERIWVVQCKFHTRDISTDKISDVNIPSLLHSYKANGYLLICRTRPTSKLTDLLERLEENCIFGYKYKCWTGETFKRRLTKTANILTQFNLTI